VAATVKEAVWPAMTVWPIGCTVIEGTTGAELLGPTSPEHPTDALASPKTNVITPRRFIDYSLSCNKFPRRGA